MSFSGHLNALILLCIQIIRLIFLSSTHKFICFCHSAAIKDKNKQRKKHKICKTKWNFQRSIFWRSVKRINVDSFTGGNFPNFTFFPSRILFFIRIFLYLPSNNGQWLLISQSPRNISIESIKLYIIDVQTLVQPFKEWKIY